MAASSGSDVLLYLLAILIPPVPVLLRAGCGADVIINIGLTIFCWIPGVIHAWWVIARRDPARYQTHQTQYYR